MKKPTIEEIKNDFAKWHGTEWDTPSGKMRLSGINVDSSRIVFHEYGADFGFLSFDPESCTPVEPLFEGWMNVYSWGRSEPYRTKKDANAGAIANRLKCIKVREVRE